MQFSLSCLRLSSCLTAINFSLCPVRKLGVVTDTHVQAGTR